MKKELKANRGRLICRVRLIILETKDSVIKNTILFKNKKWNKYVSLGGRVENSDFTFECALTRETLEESINLIDISEIVHNHEKIKFCDIFLEEELIRVYFLKVETKNLDLGLEDIFKNNLKIINQRDKRNIPNDWKEMDSIKKFPFTNIVNSLNTDNNYIRDSCGIIRHVYYPVLLFIEEGLKQGIIEKLVAVDKYEKVKNLTNSFLLGTHTIKLKC